MALTMGKATVIINNMPKYAMERNYVVARYVDGSLWFYGAWDEINEATRIADELGNGLVVVPNECAGGTD